MYVYFCSVQKTATDLIVRANARVLKEELFKPAILSLERALVFRGIREVDLYNLLCNAFCVNIFTLPYMLTLPLVQ